MMTDSSRLTLGDLKPFLTCRLCQSYLTEAATSSKCLHSFCYRCIANHLSTNNFCPTCNKLLHPKRPLSKIRRDRALQRLVYKIVPGLLKRPETSESTKDLEQDSPEPLFSSADYFSICLQQISPSVNSEAGPLEARDSLSPFASDNHKIEEPRYLFCSAIISLKILKKFLCFKFSLTSRYEIGMLCCNQLFDDADSLLDVAYISKWTMSEPLKIHYLILDKEKLAKFGSERNMEAHPSSTDHPSAHPSSPEPVQSNQSLQEPSLIEPSVLDAGVETGATDCAGSLEESGRSDLVPVQPVDGDGSEVLDKKNLRGRVKSTMTCETKETVLPQRQQSEPGRSKVKDVTLTVVTSRRSRRKRKLEDPDVLNKELKVDTRCVKRQATNRSGVRRHSDVTIPVAKLSPDTTCRAPEVLPIQSDQLQEHHTEDGTVPAPSTSGRVTPIKISLDGSNQLTSNFAGRTDQPVVDPSRDSNPRQTYQLQRKDDLRVQLSRRVELPLPVERFNEINTPDIRKRRVSGSGKRSSIPSKTRKKKPEKVVNARNMVIPPQNSVLLRALSEGKFSKVVDSLPGTGFDFEEKEYPRVSYSRKRRVPSVTVTTPSPVVFDTEICTSPSVADKKVSRFQRKKVTKIPKVVSISTIPSTFILTSSIKPDHCNHEKILETDKPASLKLYLKMVDERSEVLIQDAPDDCFMVSSTVADDEGDLEYPGSGNSSEMSPDSVAQDAPGPAKTGLPARSSASVLANRISCENGPSSGHKEIRNATPAGGASILGGPKDVGQKRKRLESVISSLKPVASVTVSTGQNQRPPPIRPVTPHGTLPRGQYPGTAFFATTLARTRRPTLPQSSPLHQLITREPLNIPKPPISRIRPPRGLVPVPLNSNMYSIQGDPSIGHRHRRPRLPRRPSGSNGSNPRGFRLPFAGLVNGVGFPGQGLAVPPFIPRFQGAPLGHRLVKPITLPGDVYTFGMPERQSKANGYDAPLELTTRRSRDSVE